MNRGDEIDLERPTPLHVETIVRECNMATVEQDVPFLTRQEVEKRAADVLREHGLDSIPVDLIVLANRLGMSVHNATFSEDNIVGMISKRGDRITLLVNHSAPPFRKLFTIAHEMGHYFLHLLHDGEFVDDETNLFRQPQDEQRNPTPEQRREIQANLFAAALLMPEEAVRSEWMKGRSLDKLARKFNVSRTAMGLRISQLGLD
jgi:Zn-dependent peptidase ImmA (M78 family)